MSREVHVRFDGSGRGKFPPATLLQFGKFSQVFPFWTAQVEPVRVQIEQATWVRNVLSGRAMTDYGFWGWRFHAAAGPR